MSTLSRGANGKYKVVVEFDVPPIQCRKCQCHITDDAYLQKLAENFYIDVVYPFENRALVAACRALQKSNKESQPLLICQSCLEQIILKSEIFDQQGSFIKNPFSSRYHRFVTTNHCLAVLSAKGKEIFLDKVYDFITDLLYTKLYCPCSDGKFSCDTFIAVDKQKGVPLALYCEKHGKRCTRCFEQAHENHAEQCSGYPKSLLTRSCKDICRCPKCFSIIERSEGCDHMSCTCGHYFKLSSNRIIPTNRSIIPLKSASIRKKEQTLRKIAQTVSFIEDYDNDEKDVGTDFWLMKKRNHPRNFY